MVVPMPDVEAELAEVLQAAHVYLQPSEQESFGLAALEAMSCGTPVVASNRGGLPELIEHGETGFLHNPTDVDAQADSVLRLLGDEELHRTMGARARAVAVEKYCIRCVIHAYMDLYDRVLAALRGGDGAATG